MKYDQKRLGRNIRALRKQLGMSSKLFCESADISTSYIGLIERGERGIAIEKLCRISEIFSVSLDELIEKEFFPDYTTVIKEAEDGKDSMQKQIIANLYGMDDLQLEFTLAIVKTIRGFTPKDPDDFKYGDN